MRIVQFWWKGLLYVMRDEVDCKKYVVVGYTRMQVKLHVRLRGREFVVWEGGVGRGA
jgi:hypothetical protein